MVHFNLDYCIEKFRSSIRSINCNYLVSYQLWMASAFLFLFVILFTTSLVFDPIRCQPTNETNHTDLEIGNTCFDGYKSTTSLKDWSAIENYRTNLYYFHWCLLLMCSFLIMSKAFWQLRAPKMNLKLNSKKLVLEQINLDIHEKTEMLHNSILNTKYMIVELYANLIYSYFSLIFQVLFFHFFALNHSFILLGFRLFGGLSDLFTSTVSCDATNLSKRYFDHEPLILDCSLRINWLLALCYLAIWLLYLTLLILTSICLFNLMMLNFYEKWRVERVVELVPSVKGKHFQYKLSRPDVFFVIESIALKMERKRFDALMKSFIVKYFASDAISTVNGTLAANKDVQVREEETIPRSSRENVRSTFDKNGNEIELQTIEIE